MTGGDLDDEKALAAHVDQTRSIAWVSARARVARSIRGVACKRGQCGSQMRGIHPQGARVRSGDRVPERSGKSVSDSTRLDGARQTRSQRSLVTSRPPGEPDIQSRESDLYSSRTHASCDYYTERFTFARSLMIERSRRFITQTRGATRAGIPATQVPMEPNGRVSDHDLHRD